MQVLGSSIVLVCLQTVVLRDNQLLNQRAKIGIPTSQISVSLCNLEELFDSEFKSPLCVLFIRMMSSERYIRISSTIKI